MENLPDREEDFVGKIVEANNTFLSWRNRLGWIQDVLTDSSVELNTAQLVYISVYLHFIGTGEIRCSEEGGHYRPSHHARAAQQIFKRLSEITTPENAAVIRKIYPWLPSFDSAFTRAEPLTRIRDIAHRNDIPRELKEEIKHTLQNKLHRSAGPEDLVTSEALLKRITSPGASYPVSFVEEFRRFHEELREFFNAGTLEERLGALAEDSEEGDRLFIKKFLDVKNTIGAKSTLEEIARAVDLLTGLWLVLIDMAGRESAKNPMSPKLQQIRMSDIGLEDFFFVVLSGFNNALEGSGEEFPWPQVLFTLQQSILNLRLGGLESEECQAIESELESWRAGFNSLDAEELLRLRATLDRCSRLAANYSNKILSVFPEKAEKLGLALGVDPRAARVFSESALRSHPVFQVSRLVAVLVKKVRTLANISIWDIIVPGKARGIVVAAPVIGNLAGAEGGPVIALIERAEGDEEFPVNVSGMIVAHEIPILSHLAVRARQKHIVFAACESREGLDEIAAFAGKMADLEAAAEMVGIRAVPGDREEENIVAEQAAVSRIKLGRNDIQAPDNLKLLPLNAAKIENCGGKAYAAARLEELSAAEGSGFSTPAGFVVPFGIMEASLAASPAAEKEYYEISCGLHSMCPDEHDSALERLREIICGLAVPDEILSAVSSEFRPDDRLMVRSSSNCEDMKNVSGAGLYESEANVLPSAAGAAILKVWASLWTRRAAVSRENSGISHDRALMAVLIQKMIVPELSFVLHTHNPVNENPEEIYMELAVGMGETLASAAIPGFPYRMLYNKKTGEMRTIAFASFSRALWPGPRGMEMKTVVYSGISLSKDGPHRKHTAKRLGAIGQFVERVFEDAQDIEGVISGDAVFLVQSRAQHLSPGAGAFSKKD